LQLLQFFDSTPHKNNNNNNSVLTNNKWPLNIFQKITQTTDQLTKFTFWPKDDAAFGSKTKLMRNRKTFTILLAISIIIYIQKTQKTAKQTKEQLKTKFYKRKNKEKNTKRTKKIKNASKYKEFVKKITPSFEYIWDAWASFFFSRVHTDRQRRKEHIFT